ncbi:hypothetical protein HaLaN_11809, partial [Haematococcus lacustris]
MEARQVSSEEQLIISRGASGLFRQRWHSLCDNSRRVLLTTAESDTGLEDVKPSGFPVGVSPRWTQTSNI